MKHHTLAVSISFATALLSAPALAQDVRSYPPASEPVAPYGAPSPSVPPERIIILIPDNTLPQDVPVGTHLETDRYGQQILVDDAYLPPHQRRAPDSSVDSVTGLVTAPGYMGPRDATGQ